MQILVQLTIWKSIDEFKRFVYKSGHAKIFGQRKKWFKKITNKTDQKYSLVLWWIKDNEPIPSPQHAKMKLELLNKIGPSNQAFPKL